MKKHSTQLINLILFYTISATMGMEQQTITHNNNKIHFLSIPEDIWLYTIAQYQIKDALRKTCKYFRDIASRTNENILLHSSLVLSQKALERFVLYHGTLGNSAIVRNLLAIGADPNVCDDNQITVMHYAAQYGYVDIVDMLLEHQAFITTDIAKDDQSPLALAIQFNQSATVERIFSACKLHGGDVLCYAVKQGALNSVRALLACKVDLNSPNSAGCYALGYAAEAGYAHIIRFLIANGAVLNCRSKSKINPTAVPLHFAACYGQAIAIQLLIEYGADVNNKTNLGITPLFCASREGHLQTVEILLDNSAHVNARNSNGHTPLDVAKKDNIKQLLITHGGKTGAELKQAELMQNQPKIKPEKDNCVMQ